MAISYVGSGTRSFVAGGSTSPGLSGGLQEGDLLVLLDGVASWSGTANAPGVPSGWTQKSTHVHSSSNGNRLTWMYREYTVGTVAPTVSYSGSAEDTHYSRIFAFRGARSGDPSDVLGSASENGSAANIGPISGVTTTADGGVVLVAGIRETDWGSVDPLSGDGLSWNEVEDFSDYATGDNLGAVLDYALTDSPTTITSKTFAVSTGNAAEATGQMWALLPDDGSGDPGGGGTGEAPQYRSSTSAAGTAFGGAVTLDKPAGVVEGDLLIAVVAGDGSNYADMAQPGGWTQSGADTASGSSPRMRTWWKLAGPSEPADYRFEFPGVGYAITLSAFSGVDAATPFDVGATYTAYGSSGTSLSAPSVNTDTVGTLVCAYATGTDGSHSTPAGMTEVEDASGGTSGSLCWDILDAAGATGVRSSTFSGTADTRIAMALVLTGTEPNIAESVSDTMVATDQPGALSVVSTGMDTAGQVAEGATTTVAASATETLDADETAMLATTTTATDSASLADDSADVTARVTSADTASLTTEADVLSAASTGTDTASLVDASASVTVEVTATDTANLTDTATLSTASEPVVTDAGTVDEAGTVVAASAGSDGASSVESATVAAGVSGTADTASLSESASLLKIAAAPARLTGTNTLAWLRGVYTVDRLVATTNQVTATAAVSGRVTGSATVARPAGTAEVEFRLAGSVSTASLGGTVAYH